MAELVRAGFERLGHAMAEANRSDLDPVTRLTRAAESYIAFAQGSPALFRLMFSKELVDLSRYAAAEAASSASFAHLIAIISTMAVPEAVADLSLAAWCLVHGYATLCLETGLEAPGHRHARAALFAGIVASASSTQGPVVS